MKSLITFLCLALSCGILYGQKPPIKFGDIPMEDLTMKSYDKDSSAAAVVLVDYGQAYIRINPSGAQLHFDRHTRIKILKKEGLEYANASIPLYGQGTSSESVGGLKAVTYNLENGKVVESKMSKDGVFKEKFSRFVNLQKFTLPDVKVGSVVEYSYKVTSDYFTNFPNWQFQRNIPTRLSEYWAIIPEYFYYEKYMQGYVPVTSYEIKDTNSPDFSEKGHHWIVKNVPAFKEEPFMTSKDDYISKMNFALSTISIPGSITREIMGSWQKLNQILLDDEDFGKVIDKSGFLKSEVAQITAGFTTKKEKTRAIYQYVSNNIEWDGTKDYYPDPLKKILEKKKGTSGDINVLLASMLDKADIPVEMVLLSTRDHGFIREAYPMTRQFNYVIVQAKTEEGTILLDATEKYLPMGMLPERCLNGKGLVISKTNHGWVTIDPKMKAKSIISADLKLNGDGQLSGKLELSKDGYEALNARKKYFKDGEEEYLKTLTKGKTWEIQSKTFSGMDILQERTKEVYELDVADHVSIAGAQIYINPYLVSQLTENPFKMPERSYPVDFGKSEETLYLFKLVIPDGYEIDELPPTKVLSMPGNAARFVYTTTLIGNMISLTSTLSINKPLFLQDDYPILREFYNQVVAKQSEQIVLKRK